MVVVVARLPGTSNDRANIPQKGSDSDKQREIACAICSHVAFKEPKNSVVYIQKRTLWRPRFFHVFKNSHVGMLLNTSKIVK